jgi:uncharacterized protein YndB with AHSA1/START domain
MSKPTDTSTFLPDSHTFNKTIHIDAPVAEVWNALTDPELMKKWISETEIEIITDWKVGNPIVMRGRLHGVKFENKGTVLQFEPEKILEYNHLSSISRLPDKPESYSVIDFRMAPDHDQTTLTVTVSNFPTETIYKHLVFYWNVTLEIIKRMVEKEE